jgi:molecular chaperone Hsp33
MVDRLIRGTASNDEIRFVAADTTDIVKTAMENLNCSPYATVILGRLLTGSLLMSVDLKGLTESLTITLNGEGPLGRATAVTEKGGFVKGYILNPGYLPPELEIANLQRVGSLVGEGTLDVIRHFKDEHPYRSTCELVSGEIAEDMTYFFFQSDQVPSAVSLGVLMDEEAQVRQAGGFVIQLLPNTPEDTILKLEANIEQMPFYTDLLDMGYDCERIIREIILKDFDIRIMDSKSAYYKCNCSKDRFRSGLMLLDITELEAMKHEEVVTECHFCSNKYTFDIEEIEEIINEKNNK